MAAVYSIRLAGLTLSGAFSGTLYTVPAGYTVVLREIDAFTPDTVPTPLFCIMGSVPATFVLLNPGSGPSSPQWRGRLVMPAGETLELSLAGGNWRMFVSGYLLAA